MKLNPELHEQMIELLVSGQEQWTGTPEEFLEAMQLAHGMMKQQVLEESPEMADEVLSVAEIAEIFMALVNVNLCPYKDFGDLQRNGRITGNFQEKLKNGVMQAQANDALREVECQGIELTPQTQVDFITSDLWDEALTRKVAHFFNAGK